MNSLVEPYLLISLFLPIIIEFFAYLLSAACRVKAKSSFYGLELEYCIAILTRETERLCGQGFFQFILAVSLVDSILKNSNNINNNIVF